MDNAINFFYNSFLTVEAVLGIALQRK